MKSKVLINARKKRRIPKNFSWVDHRLVRENYLKKCSTDALALYLFLVTVGDHEGLSYYGDESITKHINLNSSSDVKSCRKELEKNSLVAYLNGMYQVLGLESSENVIKDFKHGVSDSYETECIGDVINKMLGGI
jgi:hypothetical protein